MLRQIVLLYSYFIVYSFIGWVYESTLCSVTGRKLVNRGFLNGPLCPIYGSGAMVVICLLGGQADSPVLVLFLSSAVLTCTLEYITSWALEKLFHARWWDYSKYRFHINGRVSLLGAVAFGALSVIVLKWLHPAVSGLVQRVPETLLLVLSLVSFAVLVLDIVMTVKGILALNHKLDFIQQVLAQNKEKYNQRVQELREDLNQYIEVQKERLEEYRRQFAVWAEKNRIQPDKAGSFMKRSRFQERRLLKAFPNMRSHKNQEALEGLRLRIQLYIKKKKK